MKKKFIDPLIKRKANLTKNVQFFKKNIPALWSSVTSHAIQAVHQTCEQSHHQHQSGNNVFVLMMHNYP